MRTRRVGSNAVVRFARIGINRVKNTFLIPSPTKFQIGVLVLFRHRRHETQRSRTRGRIIRRSNAPPRRSGGRGSSRSGRVSRGWGRVRRRASHQLEIKIFQKRAIGRYMPRLLSTVADWADARTRNSTVPPSLNNVNGEGRESFERSLPFFA